MSALGQKQTSDCRPLMSAIPPKADIDPSASDCSRKFLFDQLIRALLEERRHVEAEQLGCLEIDH
jgi:hypothetical protein